MTENRRRDRWIFFGGFGAALHMSVRRRRLLSVAAFSLLFTYLLSFLFEGQVMYDLMAYYDAEAPMVVTLAITAHLAGLFSCGYFVKSPNAFRNTILAYTVLSVAGSVPFFFSPGPLWLVSGLICGFAAGCAVATWGYFFKTLSTKAERLKTCADCLAGTYVLLFFVNLISNRLSPFLGLSLAILCLLLGALCVWQLWVPESERGDDEKRKMHSHDLRTSLGVLCIFIIIITINAGLMYSVVNPAFAHLSWLTSWYVVLPYIAALFTVRSLSTRRAGAPRSGLLYGGMGLLMLSFIAFMLADRSPAAYLGVATLMVFAFGVFDLFWWSILGDMLDFTDNPVRLFGAGLAANVLGVLLGRLIGQGFAVMHLSPANITVTALVAICLGLAILPPLNHRLLLLLKSHAYLTVYWEQQENEQENEKEKTGIAIQPLDPLTEREKEILRLILDGKSNKTIAAESFVSENTVKTHVKNIYTKFEVSSRAELISLLLRNQIKQG